MYEKILKAKKDLNSCRYAVKLTLGWWRKGFSKPCIECIVPLFTDSTIKSFPQCLIGFLNDDLEEYEYFILLEYKQGLNISSLAHEITKAWNSNERLNTHIFIRRIF